MRLLPSLCLIVFLLLAAAAAVAAPKLDPISAACLSCHDGSSAIHSRFCLLGQPTGSCGGHIVSASYTDLAAKDETLHPESRLPPKLVLYEGLITCVTCHGSDPHTGEPLALDNTKSALCRGCHLN